MKQPAALANGRRGAEQEVLLSKATRPKRKVSLPSEALELKRMGGKQLLSPRTSRGKGGDRVFYQTRVRVGNFSGGLFFSLPEKGGECKGIVFLQVASRKGRLCLGTLQSRNRWLRPSY